MHVFLALKNLHSPLLSPLHCKTRASHRRGSRWRWRPAATRSAKAGCRGAGSACGPRRISTSISARVAGADCAACMRVR